jgi:diphosphomevalonate decarboxylase
MNIRVESPANIAFIKYWGQRDPKLVLPVNDSFSMNLSSCITTIEMERVEDPTVQEMEIKLFQKEEYQKATESQILKVTEFYKTAKKFLHETKDFGFKIKSANSFPMKAGIASSASFFSALAFAFAKCFERDLDEKALSILARLSGSGSACRSVPDGFVWWHKGVNSPDSYAESIAPPDYWDIADLVLVVSADEKKTGSQDGHTGAQTSTFFEERLKYLETATQEMKTAFLQKDFTKFGTMVEAEAYNFSNILKTQKPPLEYWTDGTIQCIAEIEHLRKQGKECYFTVDAGANLHLICQQKDMQILEDHFKSYTAVQTVISNIPVQGTHTL